MSVDLDELPHWLAVEFVDAMRANEEDETLRQLASTLPRGSASKAARELARFIAAHVPYRFDGDAHRIDSYERCVGRGYGACADAAAVAATVLLLAGYDATLCYETLRGHPDYAHVRVYVGDTLVEPWPSVRRPAKACTMKIDVVGLLRA